MIDGIKAIAIVGCGGMGSGHAYALGGKGDYTGEDGYSSYNPGQEKVGDLQERLVLVGVYDIDPERMNWAAENGFPVYPSYEACLADPAVDIILIAVPNHLHKGLALQAIAAGKHVLCEKPVMMNSTDLEEVIAAAKAKGVVFYPRQNRRWDKDFLTIKRLYDDGLLGSVFSIESRVLGSRGIPGDWRARKEFGGGMMLDWGVHLLDRLLCMMPGKVTKVFCHLSHVTEDEVDDGFQIHLTLENGMTAVIEVGTCNFISKPLWYMAGINGTAIVEDWDCNGRISILNSWEDKDAKPILAGEGLTKTMAPRLDGSSISDYCLPDVFVDRDELYCNVVDTIEGKAEQLVRTEEALRVLRLMEACIESDKLGTVINFEV